MHIKHGICLIVISLAVHWLKAQPSKVGVADNGDGTYRNPVLHADYSDPDAIRVGNDYYLVASSFEDVPGLPILHSKDLVNWRLVGHALHRLPPYLHFAQPRHGEGVWAPSLRYHQGIFYLYYPDPDFGIYLIKATKAEGPWTEPVLVAAGKGLIDPCPLWDEDGQAYLVHAFAGSRAGIKSVLAIKRMSADGSRLLDDGVLVYDGHELDPTIEGPKLYKRQGWYYIFAPAGGVATGWQTVLRSKNIYGPYERRVVMDQGTTPINGPHQGAWITTQSGEDWFLHFQDKDAYGRVLHLQPMQWKDGWPVIGYDKDGDGKGEPVLQHKKPDVGKTYPLQTPPDGDEFTERTLGKQWQWMANPQPQWAFLQPAKGWLRLFAQTVPDSAHNLWEVPFVLQQKFPAEEFSVTVKLQLHPNPKSEGERAGLVVMGLDYAGVVVAYKNGSLSIAALRCLNAGKGAAEVVSDQHAIEQGWLYLRLTVTKGAVCRFAFSADSISFSPVGAPFAAQPGRWKGAKLGLFCSRNAFSNDAGYADIDWFRVEPLSSGISKQ